jgi:cadmium resistance protein CadD (predicted permease)
MPEGVLSIIVAVGSILTMLIGLWLVFARLKTKNQGFGPSSLKAIGLVLFIPTLVLTFVSVKGLQTETLAALLGVVAGYVLSYSKSEDKDN